MGKKKKPGCSSCRDTEAPLLSDGVCITCSDLRHNPLRHDELDQYRKLHTRIKKHAELRARGSMSFFTVGPHHVTIMDSGPSPTWKWAPRYCDVPSDIFLLSPDRTHRYRDKLDEIQADAAFKKNQEDAKRFREEQEKKDKERAKETVRELTTKYPDILTSLA